jgi:predicted DsbA family dithiol-disulfide isomerase
VSPEVAGRVRDDVLDAEAMDITAVPTFFVNGRRHTGPYDAQSLIRALVSSAERSSVGESSVGESPTRS